MLVFNLTEKPLNYRGRELAANGGSFDFKDMSFIPNRDLELQSKKVLAFGALPEWWKTQQASKQAPKPALKVEVLPMKVPEYPAEHVEKMSAKIEIYDEPQGKKNKR